MPSFQVPVLGSTVGFLSPFPDSLPQLFLRCLPYAFAFGLSPSNPLPFVRFCFSTSLLRLCFFFSVSSRLRLTVASPVRPFRFRFFGFPRSSRPGLPCLLSRFFVLGFLFVSFRPSLIRSHSCSSGASLLLSLSGFPLSFLLPFVRFMFRFLLLGFLFLPFLFLPVSASQLLPRCSRPLSILWFSPFSLT